MQDERIRPSWYVWLAMLASSLVTSTAALGVAIYVNAQSERKWCSVVTTLDDAYRETPPTTVPGRNLAASIADLRGELGCER